MRTILASVGLGLFVCAGPARAAVFTVTNVADDGAGSLRQALLDANNNVGADTIEFAIPALACSAAGVCSIALLTALPDITDPVTIDGTTQPRYGTAPDHVCATAAEGSYLRIEITNSDDADRNTFDVVSGGGESTFRGLSIGGGNPISFKTAASHRVQCDHIGVNAQGNAALLSTGRGVTIESVAAGVIVGTDGDGVDDGAEGNLFGGGGFGIYVNSNDDNTIAGNHFGVGADGSTGVVCNTAVYIRQGSERNLVGSDLDGVSDDLERNVFASCTQGVQILSGANGPDNEVAGNWIGVDANGLPAGNVTGVRLSDEGQGHRVRDNYIAHNTVGILIEDTTTLAPGSAGNCVEQNLTGLEQAGSVGIAFEGNWWGAADGPSGLGPGTGDSVVVSGTGAVDFEPFATVCAVPEPTKRTAVWSAAGVLFGLAFCRRSRTLESMESKNAGRRLVRMALAAR